MILYKKYITLPYVYSIPPSFNDWVGKPIVKVLPFINSRRMYDNNY